MQRLSGLRSIFTNYNVDGYIIPHSDEYQNEYTPDYAKRLQYITGFTGSNGIAIITKDNQYFWTDGRYKIQAQKEVPDYVICGRDFSEVWKDAYGISYSWILDQVGGASTGTYDLHNGAHTIKIGYNPMLFTAAQLDMFSSQLQFVPIIEDLVDAIWRDKPKLPNRKAYLYPIQYAGMDAVEKLKITRINFIGKAKYALITEPDSICWLLNIRGSDIESVPVILCYMILSQDEAICFADMSKITEEIKAALSFVQFKPKEAIFDILKSTQETILFDPDFCSLGMQHLMNNKVEGVNPCLLPKACKNAVEIQNIQEGHVKDAVAVCTGLAWAQNNRGITEYDLVLKLTEFRSKQDGYVEDSFQTIAGFRENGASIHYHVDPQNPKVIDGDGILLVDSGGHYWGCTTDVTRVLVFGEPTDEQRRRYTQVLKGHISLASICVPVGAFGGSLDVCARQYLWEDGVDYVHGTGHGVGNMLSVHEHPRYIWSAKANVILKEGMVVSNEPGFYKEGEFGIRIENMLYVKQSKHKGFLECEMLTLIPYARDLIDLDMLDARDKAFLKEYYARIRKLILPKLASEARKWCEYNMSIIPGE